MSAVAGGAPEQRGPVGPTSAHGGLSGAAIAAPGGAWVRSAGNSPTWTPAGGAPVAEGRAALIGGTGTCLWAAPSTDRLVRIRPGAANGPPVRLGGAFLSSETSVAIATRTAWAVAPLEQTLVKVPLPAC